MKSVRALMALIPLLCGGGLVWAGPEVQYVTGCLPEDSVQATYAIDGCRNSWELRETWNGYFAYRFGGYSQSAMWHTAEDFMLESLTTDGRGLSGFFDWHPLGGNFRISTGIFLLSHSIDYRVAPSVNEVFRADIALQPLVDELINTLLDYEVSMEDIESHLPADLSERIIHLSIPVKIDASHIHGYVNVRYRRFAPYYGFGWSSRPFARSSLRYSFDIGMVYYGKPDVDIGLGGDITRIHPEVTAALDEWLSAQKHELRKDISKYSVVPRLSFGLSYSF